MGKINWVRVFLCGLVAGLVWTLLSIVITASVGYDFVAAVSGGKLYAPRTELVAFHAGVNILMGIWAIWLYAAIRPRYGQGPKTAAVAGFAWWVIGALMNAIWGSLGFVPPKVLLMPVVAALPAIIVAAVIGAWAYKE
jgi:hypothetical protein